MLRMTFWSAQPEVIFLARTSPIPGISRSRSGDCSMTSKHRRAEGLHQFAGIDRADPLDHARAEVAFDARQGGRRGNLDEHGAELPTMLAIGDPVPGSGSVFTRGNDGSVADQGDQFPLTLHLQAQHTKAVLRVVEGDAFNEASETVEFGGGSRQSWRGNGDDEIQARHSLHSTGWPCLHRPIEIDDRYRVGRISGVDPEQPFGPSQSRP
jgi:hypothetical protein